ncbi:MAG: trehalose-phosphatase [Thermomicrobiales bacterium]
MGVIEMRQEAGHDIDEVVERCVEVLGQRPSALLSDIDGTISEIAATPGEATVHRDARDALVRLRGLVDIVGIVTGRAAIAGEAMVAIPGILCIGNHGLERRRAGVGWEHPAGVAAVTGVAAAIDAIRLGAERAGVTEGILFEDKRLTGTVHYRLAADPDVAKATLRRLVSAAAERHGLRVTEGRYIFELRPLVIINKGTAIRDLIAEDGLRGVVFLGDDVTDVDGFEALRAARDGGHVASLAIGVVGAETPRVVYDRSDVRIDGVSSTTTVLTRLAARLDAIRREEGTDARS